jgi:molybdate transport system substrate-binding protein
MHKLFRPLLATGWLMMLAGCGTDTASTPTPASSGPWTVFAASSLQDVLKTQETVFRAAQPGTAAATFNFAGSQALAAQLEQGAQADLFISADEKNMQRVVAAGLAEPPQVLAGNSMVIVLPPGNPAGIHDPGDLRRPGVKLVIAAPAVPAGDYTVRLLNKLSADSAYGFGYKDEVLARVVSQEDNVRSVLAKVQLGEADAGIVYRTDAQTANAGSQKVETLEIPDRSNVTASYDLAVLKTAPAGSPARAFRAYLLSPAGQAALAAAGFSPAPTPTP